jgi:hypothetical protein
LNDNITKRKELISSVNHDLAQPEASTLKKSLMAFLIAAFHLCWVLHTATSQYNVSVT